MDIESYNLKIVLILTVGFASASILGYISQRAKLSPILGYLLAGYIIGPYSPGFVADLEISEQLAEIGVILMMFGVGLHFKWEDLVSVKSIAIPGAVLQTIFTTFFGSLLIYSISWSLGAGIIISLGIAVASTVVLVRVLTDNNLLTSPQGHIAVGWTIVEDMITVVVLLLLPTLGAYFHGTEFSLQGIAFSIAFALLKFVLLGVFMFTWGYKIVTYILTKIARTRSHELFTLAVLSLTFVIATGSALLFGASIALGSFVAGMVIGQTELRHQASANALPLKDTFFVIFFLSVGMLFNPNAIAEHLGIFLAVLAIVLVVKPLAAFLIITSFRYPFKTALMVSVLLAQIGEFSFILAEESLKLKVLPDEGYDIIVACALISISLNPLFFKIAEYFKHWTINSSLPLKEDRKTSQTFSNNVILVGFGPIGQNAMHTLESMGFSTTVIDRNVDAIAKLKEEKRKAVYGDASHPNILEIAHVESALLLVITVPEIDISVSIIEAARQLNPKIPILARAQYSAEKYLFDNLDIHYICSEEESKKAFNQALLRLIKPFSLKIG